MKLLLKTFLLILICTSILSHSLHNIEGLKCFVVIKRYPLLVYLFSIKAYVIVNHNKPFLHYVIFPILFVIKSKPYCLRDNCCLRDKSCLLVNSSSYTTCLFDNLYIVFDILFVSLTSFVFQVSFVSLSIRQVVYALPI